MIILHITSIFGNDIRFIYRQLTNLVYIKTSIIELQLLDYAPILGV